ncbi:MAG: L,D-transpeptidase family protein [Bryobacteraceae bacterium]
MRTARLLVLMVAAWQATASAQLGTSCESELCKLAAARTLPSLRWPDFSDQRESVERFYAPTGFAFAWTQNGRPTEAAYRMIQFLTDADQKGLNPDDYDASRWEARIGALQASASSPRPSELAEFDLEMTVNALRLVSHLHFGRANPGWFHGRKFQHEDADIPSIVHEMMLPGVNARTTLDAIEPPFESYRQTQKALQKYVALTKEGHDDPLPVTDKPLDPKKPYPALDRMAAKLRKLGDLPESVQVSGDIYGGALVDAVKHFQARHGLDTDGRIGKGTFAALNMPIEERVGQLQRTLERWRWVPHHFSRPPIVVNIPEFDLRALNDKYTTELEMKVVVGKAYRTQTPVFAAEMKSVVFRPYWNVPVSIQRKELVPKAVKDREYLRKNDYEVVTPQDVVISDGTVDDAILAQLRSAKLRLRQRPGPTNSLGLIKFNFPNEYDVYMHDTPARVLFSQSRRDFSHGCIRLEKPAQLAEWVLRGDAKWTAEQIAAQMEDPKRVEVAIKQPIPVLIVYATAVVPSTGEVLFFNDIYGEDARLAKILSLGPPYADRPATSGEPGPRPRE